jgi:hypothetical protein
MLPHDEYASRDKPHLPALARRALHVFDLRAARAASEEQTAEVALDFVLEQSDEIDVQINDADQQSLRTLGYTSVRSMNR